MNKEILDKAIELNQKIVDVKVQIETLQLMQEPQCDGFFFGAYSASCNVRRAQVPESMAPSITALLLGAYTTELGRLEKEFKGLGA